MPPRRPPPSLAGLIRLIRLIRQARLAGYAALSALAVAATLCLPATAHAGGGTPSTTSFTFEATIGPGWRSAADGSDRSPGFDAVSGGGDVVLGVSFGGVGLAAGGHSRVGKATGDRLFVEAAGDLSLQVFLGERVRARAGVAAGQAFLGAAGLSILGGSDRATYVGGLLSVSLDLVSFLSGRAALCLALRFDVDGFLTDNVVFPRSSLALALGLGFRY